MATARFDKNLARGRLAARPSPCTPEVANRHTGYLVGGTSPFGTRKLIPSTCRRHRQAAPRLHQRRQTRVSGRHRCRRSRPCAETHWSTLPRDSERRSRKDSDSFGTLCGCHRHARRPPESQRSCARPGRSLAVATSGANASQRGRHPGRSGAQTGGAGRWYGRLSGQAKLPASWRWTWCAKNLRI